jgi:peroxiredoxin
MVYLLLPLLAVTAAFMLQGTGWGAPYTTFTSGILGTATILLGIIKVSSRQNVLIGLMVSIVLAGLHARVGYSLLGLMVLVGPWGFLTRFALFDVLFHLRYRWLEPIFLIITLGLEIGVWFYEPQAYAWAFGLPYLVFASLGVVRQLIDYKYYDPEAQKRYKVAIGEPAPDFELPDQNGEIVRLSQFRGQRHVLLIFVRGDWCPFCHVTLRVYERERKRFQGRNVLVMAIGPDPVGVNKSMVERLGLDYKVLADDQYTTVGLYGIHLKDKTQNLAQGEPLPAAFLVDSAGVLRYTSNPQNVGEFLTPETIFPVLEKL